MSLFAGTPVRNISAAFDNEDGSKSWDGLSGDWGHRGTPENGKLFNTANHDEQSKFTVQHLWMRHSWTNRYRRQEEKKIENGSFVQLCASVLSWQFSKAWPFVVARHDEVEQSWTRAARVIMRPSPLGHTHWPWDVEQWHECGWRYFDWSFSWVCSEITNRQHQGWQCDRSCLTGLNCTFLIPDFVQTNPLLISLQDDIYMTSDDCSEIVSLNFEPQCHNVSQCVTMCHNGESISLFPPEKGGSHWSLVLLGGCDEAIFQGIGGHRADPWNFFIVYL